MAVRHYTRRKKDTRVRKWEVHLAWLVYMQDRGLQVTREHFMHKFYAGSKTMRQVPDLNIMDPAKFHSVCALNRLSSLVKIEPVFMDWNKGIITITELGINTYSANIAGKTSDFWWHHYAMEEYVGHSN